MKHFYMMRHGQTLFNVRKKIQGWCDSPLTEKGIEQATKARDILKDIPFDHYYSSTAERACDTLEIVTEGKKPYKRLKGLKERYFGIFEGESEDLNPHFENFRYDDLFPHYGGETTQDVRDRLKNTITEFMDQDDHQCVLAVSHAGASMAFLSTVTDPLIVLKNGGFSNCCILHYTYDNKEFKFIEILRPED